jgi:glycosyltransferase involved in cell wall biosynthesis
MESPRRRCKVVDAQNLYRGDRGTCLATLVVDSPKLHNVSHGAKRSRADQPAAKREPLSASQDGIPAGESPPEYSIVIPVYNEQETLPALYERLAALLERLDGSSEVLLVDDGSRDASFARMIEMSAKDARFKVLQLSRNFGHQAAITAGLDFALGRAVVVMDADLQDPPEVVLDMAERWREGFDVVYAVRRARRGESRFKVATAAGFYRLLRKLSDVEIPADVGDFRLVDRKALDAYKTMRENDRFVRGMFSWVGFKQIGVPYDRDERFAGETKFPLGKMMKFGIDGIVSFSSAPLRLALALGFVVSGLSILYGFVALLLNVIGAFTVPGWTSIIFVTSLIGGVQLIVLGVVGEYVGRTYEESKNRPLYIVTQTSGIHEGSQPEQRVFVWRASSEEFRGSVAPD